MSRILFTLVMLLAVVALELKIHPPTRWTRVLATEADLDYLREQSAIFRKFDYGYELKMNATGYVCLQNLRDCQAMRQKTCLHNLQNSIQGLSKPRQQVVRQHETFAAVDDPEARSPDSINQQSVDLAVLDISSRVIANYEKALTRYEAEN